MAAKNDKPFIEHINHYLQMHKNAIKDQSVVPKDPKSYGTFDMTPGRFISPREAVREFVNALIDIKAHLDKAVTIPFDVSREPLDGDMEDFTETLTDLLNNL